MIGYGGGTTSKVQLAQLAEAGWGMMFAPQNTKISPIRYAVDNGAWYSFTRKRPWNEEKFLKMLDRLSTMERKPDFGVCPDKVAQGLESLSFSVDWTSRLPKEYPWYLAVQDGMTAADVRPVMKRFGGIFVGGTSNWKMSSLAIWASLARELGCPLHVGRVNTLPRAFVVAKIFKADSFDGSSWNRTYSRNQTKDGKPIYLGRSIRTRDTAKPIDVARCPQLPIDLFPDR